MKAVELTLEVLVVLALTYFAFQAVGEFPLNVFVAVLAFVVAGALMLRLRGG